MSKKKNVAQSEKMSKRKKTRLSLEQRNSIAGYLFILPWLIGILTFVAWPMIQSIMFCFNEVKLLPTGRVLNFVGFQHFGDIWLRDMYFITRLVQFFLNTILRVPVIVVFALIIAILINQKIRFQGVFRTIFFLPVIIVSGPVMTELASQGATTVPMLNTADMMVLLNQVLPTWLAEPVGSVFSEIILILWYSGVQILIFLAALQKVNPSLYEAAKIDGGSSWECFWKITLPTIKPMILVNLVYTVVTLANSGTNDVITLIMDNVFNASRGYGFATAMAWMYTIIISLILIIIFLLFVEHEDKRVKAIRKRNKKEQKALRKARATIARNDAKMERRNKKAAKKQRNTAV
ncbi:sugar ABC transporter permease [Turicibacter bilis]|uniref:carbohydrate ABC transporter permease n=1 Tax=Turicibacter bilis TaxID=2735723 RepID=UPI002A652DD8|nr:sugar ABC transporter permease [Turicibacter sp.]